MKTYICRICNNVTDNMKYIVKEMMFGCKEEFEYFECSNCGCLQIAEFPGNMDKYYPTNYYAYDESKLWPIIKFLMVQVTKYILFEKGIVGKLLYNKYSNILMSQMSDLSRSMKLIVNKYQNFTVLMSILSNLKRIHYPLNLNTKILDIGCGTGYSFLIPLKETGFKILYGADPFIPEDRFDQNLAIYKKEITQLNINKHFDVITLSHSFEHIPNQLETLIKISELLSEDGVCIIAIPVKSKYIWGKYGVYWAGIDAPRHFFLHTLNSLTYLTKKTNLKLEYVYYDSTDFQFWGSEQRLKDIPFVSENSYAVNSQKSLFDKSQIKNYKEMAKKLNDTHDGDRAVFYFVKK